MQLQVAKDITWWFNKIQRKDFENILLVLSPSGIKVVQSNQMGNIVVDGFLSKKHSSIVKYKTEDKEEVIVALPDFDTFCKLVDSFDDLIDFDISKTTLVMKTSKKKVFYQLIEPELIKGEIGKLPVVKFENVVSVSKEFLDKLIKDVKILEAVKVVFDQRDNELKVTAESDMHHIEYKLQTKEKCDGKAVIPRSAIEETVSKLSEADIKIVFADKLSAIQVKERSDDFYMVSTLAGEVEE
jgi:hypothetical protein